MSHSPTKPTPHTLAKRKGGEPIVAVTAYDAVMAHYAGQAGVDIILVGDSVGNTALGLPSTIPVTLDMIVHHAAAVSRVNPPAMVVGDVPFGEAHFEFGDVLKSCQRLIQEAGVDAVKIEGGRSLAPTMTRLVDAGVPVWGHIGLMPQHVKQLGRYKKYGLNDAETAALVDDAKALEEAGCFALLLELVKPEAARIVTESVSIPVIGIGAGAACDGQILVCTDLLGLTPGYVPGFVEKFVDAGAVFSKGFADFKTAVRERRYPAN